MDDAVSFKFCTINMIRYEDTEKAGQPCPQVHAHKHQQRMQTDLFSTIFGSMILHVTVMTRYRSEQTHLFHLIVQKTD